MNNPEVYLGPNYQAVIDWWTYYDHLNNTDYRKYRTIYPINTDCVSEHLSRKIISYPIVDCIRGITDNFNLRFITYELIAMHELLDRNYEFPYIKLVEKFNEKT